MLGKRFAEEQIIGILKEAEAGVKTGNMYVVKQSGHLIHLPITKAGGLAG